jgi:fido (protein-threonine AMPylation protein)
MSANPRQRKVGRWPELVVSSKETRQAVYDAVRRGELRQLASRIYSPNKRDEPAQIIRRHWLDVISRFFPRAVVSDRSATDPSLIVDGNVFVVHEGADRELILPGLAVRARRGAGPLNSDIDFGGGQLYRASDARLLVENLIPARTRLGIRRRLTQHEIEEYLDRQLRRHGENWLKRVCDQIPQVAAALALPEEGKHAQALVREFLGTHTIRAESGVLKARLRGTPFDPDRLQLFQILGEYLARYERRTVEADASKQPEFPFFEAYFSNFIEGTEFELDEARRIVRTHEIPVTRPKDAHDILGTYELVSDPTEMSRRPSSGQELIDLLRERHRSLMSERSEVDPGGFKTRNNQAGGTTFVNWELVEGTLVEGFDIGRSLIEPFARALYLMFLVAEVHPFVDGNGRLARIFLNCELFAKGQQRILVPTSKRGDYLDALRLMSRRSRPELLARVMGDLQDYSAGVDWSAFDAAREELDADRAFEEISSGSLDLGAIEAAARRLSPSETA